MQIFEIRNDLPLPTKSEEYTAGTKIDNDLPLGCSVFVTGINPQKLHIRLKRINNDKQYSIRRELYCNEEGFRVYRIK